MNLDNIKGLTNQLDNLLDAGKGHNQTLETLETQLSGFVQTASQTIMINKSDIRTLEDKLYIDDLYKKQVELGMKVLEIASDIRIGAPAHNLYAWAQINESITNAIAQFVQYKKMIHDIEIMGNPDFQNTSNTQINIFDSKSIMDKIKTAKQESEIDTIEAVFEIETNLESIDKMMEKRNKGENVSGK